MRSVVSVSIVMGIVLLSLVFHELGHLIAKRKYGVKVKEITIGFPWVKKLCYRFRVWDTSIVLSPFLFGATTRTDEKEYERLKALPYDDQAFVHGAGIMGSIFFAGAILLVDLLLTAKYFSLGVVLTRGAGISILLMLLWYLREYFCSYIILLVGAAEFLYVPFALFKNVTTAQVDGPVMMGALVVHAANTVYTALFLGAVISLLIAIVSAFPFRSKIFTSDAGLIMEAFMRGCGISRRWVRAIWIVVGTVFLLVEGVALFGDFIR